MITVNLITDRNQNDVYYFEDLKQEIINRTATPEMWNEWFFEMRGRHTPSHTMNRVAQAVGELADLFNIFFGTLAVEPKTNWEFRDIPTAAELQRYLDDIRRIHAAIARHVEVPNVPESMDKLNYRQANDIERILQSAVDWLEEYLRVIEYHNIRAGQVFNHSGAVMYFNEAPIWDDRDIWDDDGFWEDLSPPEDITIGGVWLLSGAFLLNGTRLLGGD